MTIEKISWAILALIHSLPALALFRPALITRLYGVSPDDTAFVLLHHRAALFAIIVLICLWAACAPPARSLAVCVAAISMISFLLLYLANGSPKALRSIAIADAVGLPFLAYVAWRAFRPLLNITAG